MNSNTWTQEPPTEQGQYWHWDGNEDCAPYCCYVLWSGSSNKTFVQDKDMNGAPWCDEVGGWWLKIDRPQLPTVSGSRSMRFGRMKGVVALFALIVFTLCGCTDSNKTVEVLQKQGYKDIQITGYKAFSCGKDDDFATGFKAVSPAGIRVSGVVCSGWLKGSTIRFN